MPPKRARNLKLSDIRDQLGFGQPAKSSASKVTEEEMIAAGWTFNKSICTIIQSRLQDGDPGDNSASTKYAVKELAAHFDKIKNTFFHVHDIDEPTEDARAPVTRSKTSSQFSLPVLKDFDPGNHGANGHSDADYIKLALFEANEVFGGNLIQWRGRNDKIEGFKWFVPNLFIRKDAPHRQTSSICTFRLLHPLEKKVHEGEGFVEKNFGSALLTVFDNHTEDGPWKLISNAEVKLPSDLSMSTAGAMPDLCSQSKIELNATGQGNTIPYAMSFVAEAKKTSAQEYHAIPQMAFPLHSTLILFIMMHYRKHGWKYDRILSDRDVERQLPESSFVFSIFYALDEVSIYVNFPYLEQLRCTDDMDRDYKWSLACEKLATHTLHPLLEPSEKVKLYMSMLVAQQHANYLENKVFAVNEEEYNYFATLLNVKPKQ